MENQLEKINTNRNLPLNIKELKIAEIIWEINTLTSFPLSDLLIKAWSRSINELRPNQDLKILSTIVNMMKSGSIDFNNRMGIQNIFLALKKYDKIKIGYVLIKEQERRDPESYQWITAEKEFFYYEDDVYPDHMIWLVDKDVYESFHLKPTLPESDFYLHETN